MHVWEKPRNIWLVQIHISSLSVPKQLTDGAQVYIHTDHNALYSGWPIMGLLLIHQKHDIQNCIFIP